ncbi:MAG: hypothetical protein V1870_00220 [Candidatus Aenigmatarchaeota archaeon]
MTNSKYMPALLKLLRNRPERQIKINGAMNVVDDYLRSQGFEGEEKHNFLVEYRNRIKLYNEALSNRDANYNYWYTYLSDNRIIFSSGIDKSSIGVDKKSIKIDEKRTVRKGF